jgi:hypothetical protein
MRFRAHSRRTGSAANRLIPAVLVAVLFCATGASPVLAGEAETPQPSIEDVKFFESEVRPLLANHCYKCHGPEKQSGGLRLDSRGAMLAGGDSGPALVPGSPGESLLVEAINYESFEMPPSGKLNEAAIATLTRWI